MIITFLRSSSLQTHAICPQKSYLEYTLGIRPPSSKSADKGTIVHKALEVMAHVSVCRRDGKDAYEDDAFGTVGVATATPDWALDQSYRYYTSYSPHIYWESRDHTDCRRWLHKALEFDGGRFDPRNLDVVTPEQRFDFELDAPWASYDYTLHDGTRLTGRFGLKGTMDLIVRDPHNPRIMEIIDWKTGKRKDWSKEGWGQKTYAEIREDPQLRLYHYAACKLYPEAEEMFVTIFYVNYGGPYSLCFTRRDLAVTEDLLRRKFEEIRDTQVPRLNVGNRCTSYCHFGTNPHPEDASKTICQFIAEKVRSDGIAKVTHEYGRKRAFMEYGSGGGRRDECNKWEPCDE